MDANTLSRICMLATLITSPAVMANDNIVALQLGKAFSKEKLDIKIADAKFHHMFWQWGDSGCQFGLGGRGGMLKVGGESTARLGGGARMECRWNNWTGWIPADVVWLDQHQFGQRGNGFKDYGGPVQFTFGIGIGYSISRNWLIGYQYEHMSNADRYDKNPGLDSHNLHIEYRF
ncbi:acyloxyacyl hydrolase [Aeromonas australiensis]|uniref:acyloxyacyl hydrolase n=1 Tax=Aeromonas australiensis TaxID=1114880 RepID=UPI000589B5A4